MTDAPTQNRTEIVVDETFPHAPETVWTTLTSGALMARWLGMTPTGFEPVAGNRFTYRTTPAGDWDGTIACEVLEVIPPPALRLCLEERTRKQRRLRLPPRHGRDLHAGEGRGWHPASPRPFGL